MSDMIAKPERRAHRAHDRDAGRHQRERRTLRRLGDGAHGQAGGLAGVERAKGRVVTIVVEAMTFIQAMRVGATCSRSIPRWRAWGAPR